MTGEKKYWAAVLDRDSQVDGVFVYGVRSTGIYCRPSCPARRPHHRNVTFFRGPEDAESAGFRPCLRCSATNESRADPRIEIVCRHCRYIEDHDPAEGPLTLAEMGKLLASKPPIRAEDFQAHHRHQSARLCEVMPDAADDGTHESWQ